MKGYLMQELEVIAGTDTFIESFAPENNFGVVFEDDGDTGYFYAVEKDAQGQGLKILDALHIYETADQQQREEKISLRIIWSRDWLKAALVIDGLCHAIFDFQAHGGYNINEFPPPNDIWTMGERTLTEELVKKLF